MPARRPLTPALSPSEGEREKPLRIGARSMDGPFTRDVSRISLSPSYGERVRVRGSFN